MPAAFDPYYEWLGISPAQQPVSHYRLLGIEDFEANPAVIERAWRRQAAFLESCRTPERANEVQRVLDHLHQAARTLLDPTAKAAYDGQRAESRMTGGGVGSVVLVDRDVDATMHAWLMPLLIVGVIVVLGLAALVPVVWWMRAREAAQVEDLIARDVAERELVLRAAEAQRLAEEKAREAAAIESDPAVDLAANDGTGETSAAADVATSQSTNRSTKGAPSDGTFAVPDATTGTTTTNPQPATSAKSPDATTVSVAVNSDPSSAPAPSPGPSPANGSPGIRLELKSASVPPKAPPPPRDDVTAAQTQMQADRAEQLAAATTPDQKGQLAARMLGESLGETDAAKQLALLREAQSLAAASGNSTLCLSLCEETERQFDVDESARKLVVLRQIAENAEDDDLRWTVARDMIVQANAALEAHELNAARDFYAAADEVMDRIKTQPATLDAEERKFALTNAALPKPARDFRPIAPLAAKAKPVADALADWKDADEQKQRLATSPDAATAHLRLGKFLCFTKGDWDEGLPHLTQGSNKSLAGVAESEAAGAADAAAKAALGDQWHDLAASSALDEREKQAVLRRAKYWYQQALPELIGPPRDRVQGRLEQIAAALPQPPSRTELVRLPWLDGPAGEIHTFDGHDKDVTALAVTLNVGIPVIGPQNQYFVPTTGCFLASAAQDSTVRVWNLQTGREIWATEVKTANVNGVAFSTFGGFVIANYDNNQIGCWNPWTGQGGGGKRGNRVHEMPMAHAVPTSNRSPTDLLVTPNGRRLIWACRATAPNIASWDTSLNQPAAHFGDGETPSVLDVSPDGRLLAAGDSRGVIRLWLLSTGMLLSEFTAHPDAVTGLDIAPDGSHVASASFDEICVSTVRGEEVGRLYEKNVRTVAFSPDGRRLISGGLREEVFLWDLPSGQRLANLKAEAAFSQNNILRLCFLPDPRGLVTGATDGKIRLWKLPD